MFCDVCSKRVVLEKGYFNCQTGCDYDICFDCVQKITLCKNGHTMAFRKKPIKGKFPFCNGCRMLIIYAAGYYKCRKAACDFYYCLKCAKRNSVDVLKLK